jgi:anti-sigma-K factor RskA
MNTTEYIASGILEAYALGAVSDQERREVECLSAIYPEVRQELDTLLRSLENYALMHSEEPPADLRDRIMAELDFSPAPTQTGPVRVADTSPETNMRPLHADGPAFKRTWLVAASVGLLALVFSYFLVSQLNRAQQTTATLQSTNERLAIEVEQLRVRQQRADQTLALVNMPGTRIVRVKGNEKAPNGGMLVYWNANQQQVAVQVESLPALPADRQYQLWALVDGKPVDAGVFDATTDPQAMNRQIARADAFAVTIERRGGSPTPTLSTLLAVGSTT